MRKVFSIIIAILFALPVFADGEFRWEEVAPLNTARMGHAAVVLNDRIYVFGGRIHQRQLVLNSVEVYNPDTDRWREIDPLPRPLCNMAAVVEGGSVYLFGGLTSRYEPVDFVIRFDVREGNYTLVDTLETAIHGMAAVNVNHSIMLMGGLILPRRFLQTGVWYNPLTRRWAEAPSFNDARSHFGMAVERTIWVVGGLDSGGPVNSVEAYFNNAWRRTARMLMPRGELGLAVFGDTLVAAGGIGVRERHTNHVDGYLIGENRWVEIPPMINDRADFPLVSLGDRIFAIGGRTSMRQNNGILSAVEMYRYHEFEDVPSPVMPEQVHILPAWPNPSNGTVNIELPLIPSNLLMMDYRGRIISDVTLPAEVTSWKWNTAPYPAGTYIYIINPLNNSSPYTGSITVIK